MQCHGVTLQVSVYRSSKGTNLRAGHKESHHCLVCMSGRTLSMSSFGPHRCALLVVMCVTLVNMELWLWVNGRDHKTRERYKVEYRDRVHVLSMPSEASVLDLQNSLIKRFLSSSEVVCKPVQIASFSFSLCKFSSFMHCCPPLMSL